MKFLRKRQILNCYSIMSISLVSYFQQICISHKLVQVFGGHKRNDRRRRKCGCGCDPIDFLQRVQILKRKRNNPHGNHDYNMHPPIIFNLLPTMGWDVMWPVKKESHRGRLLLVRVELKGAGERFSSYKLEICR